jgi:hypothetical protein
MGKSTSKQALQAAVEWHQRWLAGANMKTFTIAKIGQYQ